MKAPWTNKTGLAKLLAIFATLLGVSFGLCGVNFIAVLRFVPLSGPGRQGPATLQDRWVDFLGGVLSVTAYLELAGMIVGLGGLVVVGVLMATGSGAVTGITKTDKDEPQ
jgi:hypothetical protein